MEFQVGVVGITSSAAPPLSSAEWSTELLRQLLEVQKEILAVQKTMLQAMDGNARWRNLIARWRDEFPALPGIAREAIPVMERAYASLLNSLAEELIEKGPGGIDNEFALQDFLDRFGMRLGQLSHLLNLVAPLSEMSSQNESQ